MVTGACGFVGSHVVEGLLKSTDWDVVTVDRLSYSARNGYDRLRDVKAYDDSRVFRFQHDLNMPFGDGLIKEMGHIDYILHLASESHVDRSITDPVPFVKNNVNITITMLELARGLKDLKRFLYFSTDEVFGTAPQGVFYSEGDAHNSGNPYSASKAASEQIVRAYANTYKLPCLITNTMNIIGERQDKEKYLPLVINKVLSGDLLSIHANKDKTKAGQRHYLHARNITAALIFILENTTETLNGSSVSSGVFNIVGEREFDNEEFALLIRDCVNTVLIGQCGVDEKIVEKELNYELVDFHSSRPGHDMRYALSGDKLLSMGFEYPVTAAESVMKIVEWTLQPENVRWLKE